MAIYVEFKGDLRICPNCYKIGKITYLDLRRGKLDNNTYKCVGTPIGEEQEQALVLARMQVVKDRAEWRKTLLAKGKIKASDEVKLPIEPNYEMPTGCEFTASLEKFPRHKIQYVNGQGYVFHDRLDGKGAVTMIHDDTLRNRFATMKDFNIVEYADAIHAKPAESKENQVHFEYTSLYRMTARDLDLLCKSRGISPEGTKKDMISRILINQGDDVNADDTSAVADSVTEATG